MLKIRQLEELCPKCYNNLFFYQEWTDDGHKEQAYVECKGCGFYQPRTFDNKELGN